MSEGNMSAKVWLYVAVSILTIWSLEAVRINQIFKKNRHYQALVFYFLLAVSIVYLVTNFIWDFVTYSKII